MEINIGGEGRRGGGKEGGRGEGGGGAKPIYFGNCAVFRPKLHIDYYAKSRVTDFMSKSILFGNFVNRLGRHVC